jgi:ornithine cyclodeaminase/alanine dehydrogenase-like protein (mu-crystallin family)
MRYAIYVHDLETGALRGIVDGLAVTNLRTGAVTALGTDLLEPEVEEAAIIGTGQVAMGQCVALQLVRHVRRLRVYARSSNRRAAFINAMRNQITAELVEATSLKQAVDGVGMVTLATNAVEPVIGGDHIKAGMHINSVGPASRDRVELDPACFAGFDHIVCDSVDLVFDEAGDAYRAVQSGFDPASALDLSDAMVNAPQRQTRDRTLFKSVGTGLQDLIVAARLLDVAATWGIGTEIDDYLSVKPFGSPSA